MKLLFGVFALLIAMVAATGQESPMFLQVRTDATIVIRKHPTGADLVEITMRDPDYPKSLLSQQVAKMCEGFGTPARGLVVGKVGAEGADPNFQFMTATFATNGIILGEGRFHLQPILQAFAGAPAPYTIQGLTVDFEGVSPTSATVQQFNDGKAVKAEARYTADGPLQGIEYRFALLSQDPSLIHFPDQFSQERKIESPPPNPSPKPSFMPILFVFVGAGIVVGALVYFAMLRNGSKSRP